MYGPSFFLIFWLCMCEGRVNTVGPFKDRERCEQEKTELMKAMPPLLETKGGYCIESNSPYRLEFTH